MITTQEPPGGTDRIETSPDSSPPPPRRAHRPLRTEFAEVLKQCRVSLLSVGLIVGAFFFYPQAQDVLRSLGQPGARWWLFELILLIWALIVWYGARFLLDHDFEAFRWGTSPRRRDLCGEQNVPRVLAAVGLIGIGCALLKAVYGVTQTPNVQHRFVQILGVINIVAGFGLYWVLRKRRDALRSITKSIAQFAERYPTRPLLYRLHALEFQDRKVKLRLFREFPRWLCWTIGLAVLVSVVVWAIVMINPQGVSPWLGAAPILLLGSVFLTLFATALVWLGERFHVPALWITLAVAGVFSLFNDNHHVRTLPTPFTPAHDFTAQELYQTWVAAMDTRYPDEHPHPMFLVAASGGGIRAAYWTASVLSKLQDQNPSFAPHTIIISPVSGGALGSLVFATLVATDPEQERRGRYRDLSRAILSQDFLAPALGAFLFFDLPAKFWPIPNQLPDRAAVLEAAWERAWTTQAYEREGLKSLTRWQTSPFSRGFATFIGAEQDHVIPTLLINGTSVTTGQRILTTHLHLGDNFPDSENVFSFIRRDIPLSTAAMMSARFTYISPAGTLDNETSVVDGGYYENSGATTALQFYEAIESFVDRDNVVPMFIQIDNDYVAADDSKRERFQSKAEKEASRSLRPFPGVSAPVTALLNTRNAHAISVAARARKTFSPCYFYFTFSVPGDVKAPLGWFLSDAAQRTLDLQLEQGSGQTTRGLMQEILTRSTVRERGRTTEDIVSRCQRSLREVVGNKHDN